MFRVPGEVVCAQSVLVTHCHPVASRCIDVVSLYQASIMRPKRVEALGLEGPVTGFQFSQHRHFIPVIWRQSEFVTAMWPLPLYPMVTTDYRRLIPRRLI